MIPTPCIKAASCNESINKPSYPDRRLPLGWQLAVDFCFMYMLLGYVNNETGTYLGAVSL